MFISAVGILQAVLLAGLLYFHPRSDKSVNKFLAFFIICLCAPMFYPLLMEALPWQYIIFIAPFTLLPGPAMYLYVRSFKETITFKKAWPHFIIFFVFVATVLNVSLTIGSKYPRTPDIPAEVLHSPLTFIPVTVRMAQMLLYYFLARKALRSYQTSIQQLFSETSKIDLHWVRWLINGYLILVITSISLYSLVLWYTNAFNVLIVINAAVFTPYIYLITYKGITQLTIWQMKPQASKAELEQEMETESLKINHEAGGKNDELINKIIAVMEHDKLYQEAELTLQQLSDRLLVPSYIVSQVINEKMNKNFYDLVNGYRVEEAKRLLVNPRNKNFTVLSVGFEAGFNSKTSFNTVFKKLTGLTPTEYRGQQKAN